jgi:hypothetical protein
MEEFEEEEKQHQSEALRGSESLNEHLRKIAYSGVYFAISWIVLNYMSHAWSTSNAWDIGLNPNFSYNGMDSLAGTVGWNVGRIAWVYLAAPIWGLIVSIFALTSFTVIEGKLVHLRTFLFWLAFNGYLIYVSYVLTGILAGEDYSSKMFTGFVAYYSWLLWTPGKIYGILIFQAIISIPAGLLFSKGILQLNYSRVLASKQNGKPIIFLNVFAFPVIIGCILIMLATFPMDMQYQGVRMACIMPLAIVALLGLSLYKAKHISIVKGGLKPVPVIGLVILISAILAARYPLGMMVEPFW